MPAKILTIVLLTFAILSLGALLAFGDSPAPTGDLAPAPQPNQAQVTPQAPLVNYKFVEGHGYATSDCVATLRVYVSYIPSVWPSWYDPNGFATDQITGSGACSNLTRIVNRSANGVIVSVDYPFYIRNQNRRPGQYKVTFLGFMTTFIIHQWPLPTPTVTPIYADSVIGKVLDNRGRPLAGAQVAAEAPGWIMQSSATWETSVSVDCPTATTCFAAGHSGTIVATTDGGATWTGQTSGTSADLKDVNCPIATTCFAVGNLGAIVSTTDGGATWSSQVSGTTANLWAVSCSNATTCTAVALGGVIVATTDGGATWNSQTSGTTNDLMAVSCPTTTSCFASGSSALILATTDGGAHWSEQSENTTDDYLTTMSCPAPATCFAFGTFGTVMATTDGGASWSTAAHTGCSYVAGGNCLTTSACSVISTKGRKCTTSDGAATWRRDPDYPLWSTAQELEDMFCPTATTCFVVGSDGWIGRFQFGLRSATTDATGNYALEHVAPNTYTLSATLNNYIFTPATRSVTVPPSATGQDFVGDFAQPTLYLPLILNAMGGQ